MKQLTEQQIQQNYQNLLNTIDEYIESPRKEKILKLYSDYDETIALAPASGKESYHNCFIGGYVDHVLNVIKCGLLVHEGWQRMGQIDDYTTEELVFALIHHDLGKIGIDGEPYYIPNPSEWHKKNQGAIYTQNPKLNFMTVPDRGLFLLQQYGIECTFNEWVAIKTHDGLYDEANKAYLISYSDDGKLRSNLPYIVQQADTMAARIEWQQWRENQEGRDTKIVKGDSSLKSKMNILSSAPKSESAAKLFDQLFNS
jgi:hypothetical protein